MYPPDPTERNCFIGGTVATNASGEKTFKYGPTRNYVLELNIVLANGDLLKLKRGELFAKDYSLKLKTENGSAITLCSCRNIKCHQQKTLRGILPRRIWMQSICSSALKERLE